MYPRQSRLMVYVFSLTWLLCLEANVHGSGDHDSYYMIVFSSQAYPGDVASTHTFATFARFTGPPSSRDDGTIETHTISWMPRSLIIVALRLQPEPGVNLDLWSSLRWARSVNAPVCMWGPYQIRKELFDRAVRQEARLRSGSLQYKAIDTRFRPWSALNCTHAVSDLDMDRGLLHVGTARGEWASQQVAIHLKPWIIEPARSHPWLSDRLGLREYEVTLRGLELE